MEQAETLESELHNMAKLISESPPGMLLQLLRPVVLVHCIHRQWTRMGRQGHIPLGSKGDRRGLHNGV